MDRISYFHRKEESGMFRVVSIIFWLGMQSAVLQGQSFLIRGTIQDASAGPVRLAGFQEDRFTVIDSVESDRGSFYFLLTDREPPGIYRIIYNEQVAETWTENRFVEFIYHRENLEITIVSGESGPMAYFGGSRENRIYREFMEFEMDYESRISQVYGRSGEAAARQYEELQRRRNRYIDSLWALHPDLYATKVIGAFRSPFIPGHLTHSERIDTLKICFFDHAAIDDPALIHAPVYPFRIMEYLSLYRVDTLSKEQQQWQFAEAVDHIMANTTYVEELRRFVVEFLMEGFEILAMETVLDHLAVHYLDESCESDLAELVEARMQGSRGLSRGVTAPDLVIRDQQGRNHELSRMDHPYVLVMFWSTTCPHCRELIAELHHWYMEEGEQDLEVGERDLEVLAISIDTSKAAFEAFTDTLQPRWIHAWDPKGWLGRVPSDYFIYSTPSLFLMDAERRILDRPVNFRQLLRALRRLK